MLHCLSEINTVAKYLGEQYLTANDEQEIEEGIDQPHYQTNNLNELKRLILEDYHALFESNGYSLHTIIVVS